MLYVLAAFLLIFGGSAFAGAVIDGDDWIEEKHETVTFHLYDLSHEDKDVKDNGSGGQPPLNPTSTMFPTANVVIICDKGQSYVQGVCVIVEDDHDQP